MLTAWRVGVWSMWSVPWHGVTSSQGTLHLGLSFVSHHIEVLNNFIFIFSIFVYLLLAVLDPHCGTDFLHLWRARAALLAVHGLLIAVASLVVEHRL